MPSYAHYSWTLIPHMHVLPRSIHLHKHSPSVLHLPLWVSTTGLIRKSQSSIAGVGLSLGENHFPVDSLTWRELLTGLTTCLFNQFQPNFCKVRITATTTGQFHSGKIEGSNPKTVQVQTRLCKREWARLTAYTGDVAQSMGLSLVSGCVTRN
jgi:hypothetical protein